MLHNLCKTSKVPFAINILALYQGYRDLTLILRGDSLVEVKTTVGNNLNSVDKKVRKNMEHHTEVKEVFSFFINF